MTEVILVARARYVVPSIHASPVGLPTMAWATVVLAALGFGLVACSDGVLRCGSGVVLVVLALTLMLVQVGSFRAGGNGHSERGVLLLSWSLLSDDASSFGVWSLLSCFFMVLTCTCSTSSVMSRSFVANACAWILSF